VPTAHGKQIDAPAAEYFPASQAAQEPDASPANVPALQGVQTLASVPTTFSRLLALPAGQDVQKVSPSPEVLMYFPIVQPIHSKIEVAAALENFPDGHALHSSAR
jgi:hypothetical protein